TQNTEAYQLYLKGRYFWDRRAAADLKKSIEYFEQALKKDPGFALAYAGLADSYALLVSGGGDFSMHVGDAISKAREAVMKALTLDESLADAHTSLGIIHLNYDWDWASAEREFKRALELNPGSSNAHYWYSLYLSAMDRPDEAIAEGRLAAQIEPLEPLRFAQVARALIYAGRFEEAVAESRKGLELDSNRVIARYMLAEAYLGLKQYQVAIAEYEKSSPFIENGPMADATIAVAHALSGQPGEAQRVLAELNKLAEREYVSPYYFIDLYSSIGDRDKAFEWVEKAYQERAGFLAYARVDNVLVRLRDDPRYADLLRRLELAS
ncbi:MAG TPA: tetratricopeptide repeat protein, partial [Blastocatellia bacterium]|nr:tetratricopeptide repeat protein [Blastocatellia bacterium]